MTRKQYSKCERIIMSAQADARMMLAESGISNEKEIINSVYESMSEKLACYWNADPSKVTAATFMQEIRCVAEYQIECRGREGAEIWFCMDRLIEKIGWIIAIAYSQQLSQENASETFFAAPSLIAV